MPEGESIKERIAAQIAEATKKREEEERAVAEERLKPTRAQIADLQAKKTRLAPQTEAMTQGYKEAETALPPFKDAKKPIQDAFSAAEAADILPEPPPGEFKKSEFVRSQEDTKEVQAYRTTGGKLREEIKTARDAKRAIAQEVPDIKFAPQAQKRDRKRVRAISVAAAEAEIAKVDSQLAELKLQTPEGQAEREEKLRAKVKDFIRTSNIRVEQDGLPQGLLKIQSIPGLAKEYPADLLAKVLREENRRKVVEELERQRSPLHKDTAILTEYFKKLRELQEQSSAVQTKRRRVTRQLLILLETDKAAAKSMGAYFSSGAQPEALSQRYMSDIETFNFDRSLTSPKLEEILKTAAAQLELRNGSPNFNLKTTGHESGYGDEQRVYVELPDLESVEHYISRLDAFYSALGERIAEKKLPFKHEDYQTLLPKDTGNQRIGNISLSKRTVNFLQGRSFYELQTQVQQESAQLEQKKQKVLAVVDADLVNHEAANAMGEFSRTHSGIDQLHQELRHQRQLAAEAVRKSTGTATSLRDVWNKQVTITRQQHRGFSYDEIYHVSSEADSKRVSELAVEMQALKDKEIPELRERIRTIEKKVLQIKGWTKRGRQEKRDEIKKEERLAVDELREKERELHKLIQEQQAVNRVFELLRQVPTILGQANISEEYLDRPVELGEFLQNLERAVAAVPNLTDQQRADLAEYDRLSHAYEEVNKSYDAAVKAIRPYPTR